MIRLLSAGWMAGCFLSVPTMAMAAEARLVLKTQVGPGIRYDVQGSGNMDQWDTVLAGQEVSSSLVNVRSQYPGYRYYRAAVTESAEGSPLPEQWFEWVAGNPDPDPDPTGEVVASLADFSLVSQAYLGPLLHYAWTAEQRELARELTDRRVVEDEITGSEVLAVKTHQNMPAFPFNLAEIYPFTDYVPPEADTIRMKIRMISGEVRLGFGVITISLGNSFCYTEFRTLTADDGGWSTVDISLHEGLSRTFRGAWPHSFGSPMIYLSRYVQEQIFLYAAGGQSAEFRIDDVELVNKGRGAVYPVFGPGEVTEMRRIADFEAGWDPERAFVLSMQPVDLDGGAECEPVDFQQPNFFSTPFATVKDRIIPWFPPVESEAVVFEPEEEGPVGENGLAVSMHGFETVIWPGVKSTPPPPGTNGLEFLWRVDNEAYGPGEPLVIDFAVMAAPAVARPFPWEAAAPPEEWTGAGTFFDAYPFSRPGEELPFAMYHARRTVPNGEWTRLHVPFADFTCGYGQGEEPEIWRGERRALDPSTIVSVHFVSPWRQLRAITHFRIDHLSFVRFSAPAEDLRSYWQIPSSTGIVLEPYFDILPEQNFNTRWVRQLFQP